MNIDSLCRANLFPDGRVVECPSDITEIEGHKWEKVSGPSNVRSDIGEWVEDWWSPDPIIDSWTRTRIDYEWVKADAPSAFESPCGEEVNLTQFQSVGESVEVSFGLDGGFEFGNKGAGIAVSGSWSKTVEATSGQEVVKNQERAWYSYTYVPIILKAELWLDDKWTQWNHLGPDREVVTRQNDRSRRPFWFNRNTLYLRPSMIICKRKCDCEPEQSQ